MSLSLIRTFSSASFQNHHHVGHLLHHNFMFRKVSHKIQFQAVTLLFLSVLNTKKAGFSSYGLFLLMEKSCRHSLSCNLLNCTKF